MLTKADLVDAAWLSLVREEVARLLRGTSLQRAPIVAVSGTSGDGLDELRAALDAELGQTTPRPDVGRPRLPVDRSFAMAGFGTVVTGTLVGGALRQGDDLVVLPGERRVRIRGLQQHNRPVEEARPGSRTAVNLSGVDHAQLGRGHVLALPGSLPVSRRLDARLVVLPNATQPLRHRQRLLIYHETAEAMVELSLLEADELRPGEEGWGQLYVTSPMVALDGDRFILRVPSPPLTVAGGVIVDSAPRRHRRKDAVVLSELGLREHADPGTAVVLELGKHAWGLSEGDLGRRLGGSRQQLADTLAPVADRGAIRRLGSRWVTREQWERLSARVTAALAVYHQGQPLRSGMPKEELRSRTGIPAELFNPALVALTGDGVVVERNGEVAAAGHRHGLTPEQESAAGAFLADLELQPFNPPPLADLVRRHQLAPSLVQYLVTQGRIVRVNDDTVFARSAYDDAVGRLRTHLSEHRTLTVAAARDVLGSSRRYVLPLLEWLDAQKITRRVGDDRILRG